MYHRIEKLGLKSFFLDATMELHQSFMSCAYGPFHFHWLHISSTENMVNLAFTEKCLQAK